MEKASDYHRDIFSGMMAKELGKDGYFGEEYNIFTFLFFAGDGLAIYYTRHEEECAKGYLDKINKGFYVSPYVNCKQRLYETELKDMDAILLERGATVLKEAYEQDLLEQIEKAKQISSCDPSFCTQLRTFWQQQSEAQLAQQGDALRYLLGTTLREKRLDRETYEALLQTLPEELACEGAACKNFYGFAYFEGERWKYYGNAYLPTTVEKWNGLRKQHTPVTGIMKKAYPKENISPFLLRKQFETELADMLSKDLLELLLQIR